MSVVASAWAPASPKSSSFSSQRTIDTSRSTFSASSELRQREKELAYEFTSSIKFRNAVEDAKMKSRIDEQMKNGIETGRDPMDVDEDGPLIEVETKDDLRQKFCDYHIAERKKSIDADELNR